jgi:ADP-ribosylglycohydrolase
MTDSSECRCVWGSGQRKGERCLNRAKYPHGQPEFCGIHKNCRRVSQPVVKPLVILQLSENVSNRCSSSDVNDKIIGMIYGALYGDALGTPFEFDRKRPIPPIMLKPLRRFARFQNKWKISSCGQYSDDTEMALILLQHMITNKYQYDKDRMILEYLKWANSKIPFLGRNTKQLFHGVKTLEGYHKRYDAKFTTPEVCENAQSNGSLMRCYPFAIMSLNNPEYLVALKTDCYLTNPSNVVYEGSSRYIESLICALRGLAKEDILSSYQFTETDVTVNKGRFSNALYCSYMSLRDTFTFYDGIQKVISSGGDTDTNASIAGALLGAFYGFNRMKENSQFNEDLRIMLDRNPLEGDFPRPVEYGPQLVKRLIAELTN